MRTITPTIRTLPVAALDDYQPGLCRSPAKPHLSSYAAPKFNLFFTTGLMVSLAGAPTPLIFLISMVGMVAAASSVAQFASIHPSAGSFITYITRAAGTKVAVAVGVITILGYIITFGGIYIFIGSDIAQNVFVNPHVWGLTQIMTIGYGVLVVASVAPGAPVAPVAPGLRSGGVG